MTDYEKIRAEMMQHPVRSERDRVIRGLITEAQYAKDSGDDGRATLFETAWRMLIAKVPGSQEPTP